MAPITIDSALAPCPSQLVEDPGSPYLIVDLFWGDDALPAFDVLTKLTPTFIGGILKATDGVVYKHVDWFVTNLPRLKSAGGDRLGTSWFWGAYHFLRFSQPGKRQAEYYLSTIALVGGFDDAAILPIVDVELGSDRDPNSRASAQQIVDVTSEFSATVKRETGRRMMGYGRSAMRDKKINDKMGWDVVWNPAYTRTMETNGLCPRDPDGSPNSSPGPWRLEDIVLWQYCGDGDEHVQNLPGFLPGFGDGKVDISVVVEGAHRPTLKTFIDRAVR
jgi:GH25 family lysozyme M1 (1,4-beta-N-acetylmuramidase)